MSASQAAFECLPDPDNPGWHTWTLKDATRFNAWMFPKLIVRTDPGGTAARLRMLPERHHTNLRDALHGGTILSFIDVSLFACSWQLGIEDAAKAVTLDLSTQFIGEGREAVPCDAVVEVLKETRRLVFVRGIVEQQGATLAAFAGTLRKATAAR